MFDGPLPLIPYRSFAGDTAIGRHALASRRRISPPSPTAYCGVPCAPHVANSVGALTSVVHSPPLARATVPDQPATNTWPPTPHTARRFCRDETFGSVLHATPLYRSTSPVLPTAYSSLG